MMVYFVQVGTRLIDIDDIQMIKTEKNTWSTRTETYGSIYSCLQWKNGNKIEWRTQETQIPSEKTNLEEHIDVQTIKKAILDRQNKKNKDAKLKNEINKLKQRITELNEQIMYMPPSNGGLGYQAAKKDFEDQTKLI